MAKFIETLWKGLTVLLGGAIVVALAWTVLYLCIPNIKDNTDKLFKWGEYAVVEETENETPEDEPLEDETPEDETNEDENVTTSAKVSFKNKCLTITIG